MEDIIKLYVRTGWLLLAVFIRLRRGGPLWIQQWTVRFCKRQVISSESLDFCPPSLIVNTRKYQRFGNRSSPVLIPSSELFRLWGNSWLALRWFYSQTRLYSTLSVPPLHFVYTVFRKSYIWFTVIFLIHTDLSVPWKVKGLWWRTVGTNCIKWVWFILECSTFLGSTNLTAKLVINPFYQQAKYGVVTRFAATWETFQQHGQLTYSVLPRRTKTHIRGKVPRQMKSKTGVKPQNSDVYVNSEVRYFTFQRGINTETVIWFV
jgi:hypothetical protein